LEPLAGYLVLAEQMFHHRPELAGAFNFGPSEQATLTVAQLVDRVVSHWGAGATESQQGEAGKPEANYLKIDSGKSFNLLRWRSIWSVEEAVLYTVDWYRRVCLHHEPARQVCLAHIAAHQQAAAAYVVA
jgi:CDP-glucose 4,6-dehydratase